MRDERGASKDFIHAMQARTAVVAIGASTLRGQGAPGMVNAAREFLRGMDLRRFAVRREVTFQKCLDDETKKLMAAFPRKGRSWGAARKAINIFLRDAFYNAYLRDHYALAVAQEWYEIPLDSATARGLRQEDGGSELSRWRGVKHLTPALSVEYQRFAFELARSRRIRRVHLDAYLWVANR